MTDLTTDTPTVGHSPQPRSSAPVLNTRGERCTGATAADYPLRATCECGKHLHLSDGTADWVHHDETTCAICRADVMDVGICAPQTHPLAWF